MKTLFGLLVLCLFPTLLTAQTATLTLEGYAYGDIVAVRHNCPVNGIINGSPSVSGPVGTSFFCHVWAIDADSAFTPADITILADSSSVNVELVDPYPTTGLRGPFELTVTFLRGGPWAIEFEANPILTLVGSMYMRPASAAWPQMEEGPVTNALIGEEFLLCAYQGGYGEGSTAKSRTATQARDCPDPGSRVLPEFLVEWRVGDVPLRSVPSMSFDQLQATVARGGLLPRWLENTRHAVPLIT